MHVMSFPHIGFCVDFFYMDFIIKLFLNNLHQFNIILVSCILF